MSVLCFRYVKLVKNINYGIYIFFIFIDIMCLFLFFVYIVKLTCFKLLKEYFLLINIKILIK